MSSVLYTFLLLAIVGAFIGGITNHLAIKMLFRPYKAKYIGKFRVPFTPGVIPKRHDEIAIQLGKLVMEHLITAEGLEKRFLDDRFKNVILSKVTQWVTTYLDEKRPTKEDLSAFFDVEKFSGQVEAQLAERVHSFIVNQLESKKDEKLKEVLPESLKQKIEEGLPEWSRYIAEAIRNAIQQDEAKAAIKAQLDKFFEGRGMLGNMLNMFLGNQSLVDFIYPDLIKFLERPTVQLGIHHFLEREWKKIEELSVGELNTRFNLDDHSSSIVQSTLKASPLRKLIENPGDVLAEWKKPITESVLPALVTGLLKKASVEAANLLQSLELDQLVSDQVREFSMQELENVILMISKKEFKMITYLGALLGGLIGIVQGFLMMFIGK